MNKIYKSLLCLASMFICTQSLAFDDVKEAKSKLSTIYQQLENNKVDTKSLYCNCRLKVINNKFTFDKESCGYEIQKDNIRGRRIELTYIMSPTLYARDLNCFKNYGKKGCLNDKAYKTMSKDLHNIYPAIGEIVANRLNYEFQDEISTKYQKSFGSCTVLIDKNKKIITPPVSSKGTIARAYLHMASRYDLQLSQYEIETYKEWDEKNPPSREECARNKLIEKEIGFDNKFITKKCAAFK